MADSNVPKFEDTEPLFDETTPVEEPGISSAESALAGAQEGLTLGFAGEAQGGIEAGLDATQAFLNRLGLTDPSPSQVNTQLGQGGPQSILDVYRQARDESQARINAAQQANPGAFTAGAVGGGALASTVAPTALMNPLGAAKSGAPILQRVAQGAVNAIPSAALASAGVSEADLTQGQVGQFAGDVTQGAALGAGIGGGLPLAGTAISAPVKAVSQSKMMQDLLDSYRTGLEGLNMSSPKFLTESRGKLKEIAGQVDDKIRKVKDDLFKEKEQIFNELEKQNVKSDTKGVIQELANFEGTSESLADTERIAIQNTTRNMMKSGYLKSPKQIENTIRDLGDLKKQVVSDSAFNQIDDSIKALRGIRDKMDRRLGEINTKLNHVIDSSEALMNRGATEYGAGSQDLGTREKLASLFESGTKYKTESTLDDILNKGLQTSKNVDISPLSQTVPEAAKLVESTTPIARRMELAKGMQKPMFSGSNLLTSTLNATKTGGTRIANKAGMAVTQNKEFLQKGIKHLSALPPERVKELATTIARVGGEKGAAYAKVLNDSVTKNNISKNAIMFGLMQQPEFRDMLRESTNEELENVENGN